MKEHGMLLRPKLFTVLKKYSLKNLFSDVSAGVIVGVVALPLAIAFAIASGVSPDRGLFTAIIAGFLISLLGGSRVQIGGPTGAFVILVFTIVQKFGYSGLAVATIMAGIFLVVLGLLKLGGLIKYIPYPIITGFTSGIAVVIFVSQIGDFFGMKLGKMPADFIGKMGMYFKHLDSVNFYALGLALGSLLFILFWPKVSRKVPGSLVVLILATVAVKVFHLPVDTIGSRFGAIPNTLPAPSVPVVDMAVVVQLVPHALSIALLAAIESLLSAVVADGMTGYRHRSNMELIAQGAANIVVPFFGGIPATGAIARTATNIKNGGKTPVAGIIHALVLLLIVLLFGGLVVHIPLAVLSAILVYVAWNMSEIHAFRSIMKGQKSDAAVLLITFLITVVVDLTVAIQVGLVFATLLFIRKMVHLSNVRALQKDIEDESEDCDSNSFNRRKIPDSVLVYEISGPFFFGSVQKLERAIHQNDMEFRVMILRMRNANYIDANGLRALEQLSEECRRDGAVLLVSDIHSQPLMLSVQTGLDKKIGEDCFFGNFDGALEKACAIAGVPYTPSDFPPTVAREKEGSA